MASLTPRQLARLKRLIDAYAARNETVVTRTGATVAALYVGNLYATGTVDAIAAQAADTSVTANHVAAGLTAAYIATLAAEATGSAVGVPNLRLPAIRNGVPLEEVFIRPAKLYRRKIADGMSPAEAFALARQYANNLAAANVRLSQREMFRTVTRRLEKQLGITGYRRVVHPEESRTGTCGLCIAASDQVYKTDHLMPIHDHCACEPVPIFGELDVGNSLNNLTFEQVYGSAANPSAKAHRGPIRASGTHAFDLKRTRYQINEHGEWGPVLSVPTHKFTGPDDIAA